jgi:flagellar hook-associated protein 1
MSISSAINAARSGLQTTSLRADILATNVANASTSGYVRRAVTLSENILNGHSSGVLAEGISRSRNEATTAQRRATSSEAAFASVLADYRTRMSSTFGDRTEGTGIVSRVADLENAIKQAALSPESETSLQGLYSAAKAVTNQFQSLQSFAERAYGETENAIRQSVSVVNEALKSIDSLNAKIAGTDRKSNGAAGLMDERDRALDRLSEYMDIKTLPREGGQIDVITREGVYLLHGEARQIEIEDSGSGLFQGVAGLSVDGVDITPGNASYAALATGRIAALFTVRNEEIPAFSAKMNAIGNDLADRFASPEIDPTLNPGEPGLFVFEPATDPPYSIGAMSINAQIDPEQGGQITRLRDGVGATLPGPTGRSDILQGMADAMAASQDLDAGGLNGRFTSFELVSHTASVLGQSRISQASALSASRAELSALTETEQSQSGVNIDDQMQELLLVEQAYAANARVIQAADDMLQRLMEL